MYKLIAGQATAAGGSEEQDLRLKAIMSQLKSTKDDKEKLENDLFSAQQEKERLEEQVKNLERERQEAETELRGERSKPVTVPGVAQQQPEAHIQPHLRAAHTPRDEHRPTQTASICPIMAQQATSQAVVLPTSQMSPEVATVQPTVSVSPEEENVGTASKGAEGAGTSVEKGVNGKMTNLQRSRPLKRKASETGSSLLISQQKKHKILFKMIESGLSQLIQDEDTPVTMLGPLKALKHNTTFSSEDEDAPSQRKTRKLPKIQKALKQKEEYFEHDEMKREPMDQD